MRTRLIAGLSLAGLLLLGLPAVTAASAAPLAHSDGTDYGDVTPFADGTVEFFVSTGITAVIEGVPNIASVYIKGVDPTGEATGSVTFVADGVALGPVTLVDGKASVEFTFPSPGQQSFEVIYSGDERFAPTTISPGMFVARTSSSVLTITPQGGAPGDQANVNQPVAFSAKVSGAGDTPTGMVKFYIDGDEVGQSVLINGVSTYEASFSSTGTHQISAHYMGTSAYGWSAMPAQPLKVGEASDLTLSASAVSVPLGGFVDLTTQAPSDASGTVTFFQGGQNVGSAPVGASGASSFRLQLNTPGTNSITATYSGDDRYSPATSLPISVEVAAAPVIPDKPITPVAPADPGGSSAPPVATQAVSLANTGTPLAPVGGILLGLGLCIAGLAMHVRTISVRATSS